MATIYGIFSQAKDAFFTHIPKEIKRVTTIPNRLFSILFGAKSLTTVVFVDYQREIFKDFWKKIMNDYYNESEQWGSAFWNYLYVY